MIFYGKNMQRVKILDSLQDFWLLLLEFTFRFWIVLVILLFVILVKKK